MATELERTLVGLVKEWRRRAEVYAVAEMSGCVLACAKELESALATAQSQPGDMGEAPRSGESGAVAWLIEIVGQPCEVYLNKDNAEAEFNFRNQQWPDKSRKLKPLYTHPSDSALLAAIEEGKAALRQGVGADSIIRDFIEHLEERARELDAARDRGEALTKVIPMPTNAQKLQAVLHALTDAEKAIKVLSTILRKCELRGFAVADEILGNVKGAKAICESIAHEGEARTAEGVGGGADIPPKPFPTPGKWFPVDLLGNPMMEHEPGKWRAMVPSEPTTTPAGMVTVPVEIPGERVAHGRWKNDREIELCSASDPEGFELWKMDAAAPQPEK